MNWITTKNNSKINTQDIPTLSVEEMRNELKTKNLRVVGFFGKQEFENVRLYIILADDKAGDLHISSLLFKEGEKSYNCFTQDIPALHNFEREFYEEFSIDPFIHPCLKPLRKNQDIYEFFKMTGNDVHEVAVGPIHAGVIEPGHFRFMCQGERVYELEIMLGYQHRGVEDLLITSKNFNNRLAESICGDSVIAYNMAYSQIMEILSDTKISDRASIIRHIALEAERIAIHIGDLGAISGDMAYLMGASIFAVTRTLVINTMLEISGSRFGRGLIDVGGVNFDIDDTLSDRIQKTLYEVEKTVKRTTEVILKMPSCISRMEHTGVVSMENAQQLGAVGMAARASGINIDSRFDFCDEFYVKYKPHKLHFKPMGDVHSRFKVRYFEVLESIKLIREFLTLLKECKNKELKTTPNTQLEQNQLALSIVEGWRGEVVHIALTGANGELLRYKIKDPSFNNWYILSMAMRNNGISDFPLCNKSFNLSYCGNDL